MKKYVSIVAAVVAATAALVAASPATSWADGAPVTDLASSVVSAPTVVSPAGGRVVYSVTFKNNGPLAVLADFSDTSSGGGTYLASGSTTDARCTTPADGAANPTISCQSVLIAAGQDVQLYVALGTPTTGGTIVNAATARISPIDATGAVDGNTANNDATATTPVTNDPSSSASYLQQGQSLTYQKHVLTVVRSTTGVIAGMSDAPAAGAMCGAAPCATGLHVGFYETGRYSGVVDVDTDFGKGSPCRSVTNLDCDDNLYFRKSTTGPVAVVPPCDASASNTPCMIRTYKSSSAELHEVVRMTTSDPDLLPSGLRVTA